MRACVEELLARARLDVDKKAFEQMLKAKFFVQPSFSIYGGERDLW